MGVCVPHTAIVTKLRWLASHLNAQGDVGIDGGGSEVALCRTAFPWVDHTYDLFGPLMCGMTVALVRREDGNVFAAH